VKIDVRDLTKTFANERTGRTVTALDGVSLGVRAGEFLCIVGPSGCGKSTLLQLLAGLDRPTSGTMMLDGRPIEGAGAERGMVFQGYALFPWRTVVENIAFGLEVKGVSRAERRETAYRYARLVGLTGFEHAHPNELSGGMKQRVGIARALANEPDVLLMDEPFGALDAQTREIMQRELLDIWRATRRTIVFVTHGVQEAVFLADRIVVMTARPGRIKATIDVDLAHPRDVTQPEFGALMRPVYAALREEVSKAMEEASGKGDAS
jgi:ABC-type nitrate/sulfonate/bicarbonate transport system ATPase subunit